MKWHLQLRALIWKLMLVRTKNLVSTLLEILIPVALFAILTAVNIFIPIYRISHVAPTDKIAVYKLNTDVKMTIVLAKDLTNADNIIDIMKGFLAECTFKKMDTEQNFLTYVNQVREVNKKKDETVESVFGIMLDKLRKVNTCYSSGCRQEYIAYYRFRSERPEHAEITYDYAVKTGPFRRAPDKLYIDTNFMTIQMIFEIAVLRFLQRIKNSSAELWQFPQVDQDIYDINEHFEYYIKFILPATVILSFIYIMYNLQKYLLEEKNVGIKSMMNMLGFPTWVIWLGWIISTSITMLIAISLVTFLIKTTLFGDAIFKTVSFLTFWLLLACYGLAAMSYCFLIISVFSSLIDCAFFGFLLWILPFLLTSFFMYQEIGANAINILYLTPTGVLTYIFLDFAETEIFLTTHYNPVVKTYFVLIINAVILFGIAFLIDFITVLKKGKFSLKRIKEVINSVRYICSKREFTEEIDDLESSENIEETPFFAQPKIEIRNLMKQYGTNYAIKNLSMNIIANEITVIVGQTGSGKSLLCNIIAGFMESTGGQILIDGYSMRYQRRKATGNIGFCPQICPFYRALTVEENLKFFGLLKGIPTKITVTTLQNHIIKLDLKSRLTQQCEHLPEMCKRKLMFLLSILGFRDILIFDDPTLGLDVQSRREMWNIILDMQGIKTIVMTSSYMEEAEALSNRIGILSHGTLVAFGNLDFLNNYFATGYSLYVMGEENYSPTSLELILRHFVYDGRLKYKLMDYYVYAIPTTDSKILLDLFISIEQQKERILIKSYVLELQSLVEIFQKFEKGDVGIPEESENVENIKQYNIPEERYSKLHSCALRCQQFRQLQIKRFQFAKNKFFSYVIPVVIAVIILLLIAAAYQIDIAAQEDIIIPLALHVYPQGIIFGDHSDYPDTMNEVRKMAEANGYKYYETSSDEERHSKLVDLARNDLDTYLRKVVCMIVPQKLFTDELGYSKTKYIIYYPSYILHGAPMCFTLLNFGLANVVRNYENDGTVNLIEAYNHYLIPEIQETATQVFDDYELSMAISILYALMMAIIAMFVQNEYAFGFQILQLSSGVPRLLYWLAVYIFDILYHNLWTALIVIFMLVYNQGLVHTYDSLIAIVILLILFTISGYPLAYLCCRTKSAKKAFLIFMFIEFISVIITVGVDISSDVLYYNYSFPYVKDYKEYATYGLYLLPQMAFTNGSLMAVKRSRECYKWIHMDDSTRKMTCAKEKDEEKHFCCEIESDNCDLFLKFYDRGEYMFLLNIYYFIGDAILYFLILLLLDSDIRRKFFDSCESRYVYGTYYQVFDHEFKNEVAQERFRIDREIDDFFVRKDILMVHNVSKCYGRLFAVRGISFGIRKGEVFGLLGGAEAGKTTLAKIIAKQIYPTLGDVLLMGYSLRRDTSRYEEMIAFCPQSSVLSNGLTCKEVLLLFAALRGVQKKYVRLFADKWLIILEMVAESNVICSELSYCQRRKLSVAIAMLSDPYILVCDELTNGLDLRSRQLIWKLVDSARNSGRSFVLATRNVEECEKLCDNIGILEYGQFRCIGQLDYIRNFYVKGVEIVIQLHVFELDVDMTPEMTRMKKDMKNQDALLIIEDFNDRTLIYHIIYNDPTIVKMFEFMEKMKSKHFRVIENYTVANRTLNEEFRIPNF